MPLKIVRQDITKMATDAIVNPSNTSLVPGGGTDSAIHLAAGKKLLEACRKLGGCKPCEAEITKGYELPCRYVIHTAGPVWQGGGFNEESELARCYESCLKKAVEYKCKTVAFPLISSGSLGFPKDRVLRIASETIKSFLNENELEVFIAVFDDTSFSISEKLFNDVKSYIDSRYASFSAEYFGRTSAILSDTVAGMPMPKGRRQKNAAPHFAEPATASESHAYACMPDEAADIDELVKMTDESFSQMLLRKIDEKGIKDSECYKKANIDRKLFSKIRGNITYKPRKTTVLAFAVALELTLEETKEMLMKAGYALTHADKGDIIVEYFIMHRIYDIFEINEVLFKYDQSLLGS